VCALGRPAAQTKDPSLRPATAHPVTHPPLHYSASDGIGEERGLGNSVPVSPTTSHAASRCAVCAGRPTEDPGVTHTLLRQSDTQAACTSRRVKRVWWGESGRAAGTQSRPPCGEYAAAFLRFSLRPMQSLRAPGQFYLRTQRKPSRGLR
jgi:hypothetical protein